ncbi:hypothetical protein MKW98_019360 [Papaver atlanticum]|uniref:Lipocalin/cytosolic fatty-acid binding domain-containing protein n=1 Tax=Papaver atlanticum TaxID=357466 RepID=A0AAD4S977_9MAGN|nr:hypothetical protein MKW98_019360 [Papaver atlanticum]
MASKKEMEVVKDLDIKRYMGIWYEIASFPSRFQPKNGVNTRATYTLQEDGKTVTVLNETWTDGKRGFIQGTAYAADPSSNEAQLKVKFYVPPFLPIIPVVGDYWVLSIDPDNFTLQKQSITEPDLQDLHVDVNLCNKRSLGQMKRWERKKQEQLIQTSRPPEQQTDAVSVINHQNLHASSPQLNVKNLGIFL